MNVINFPLARLEKRRELKKITSASFRKNKNQIFEMPIGGAATMNEGDNLVYLARKEQCLALGTQLRGFKINDYKIYRVFPTGEVQYLHPKDGVFPEKSNPGRVSVNNRAFSIGKNPNPVSVKFTGKGTFESGE